MLLDLGVARVLIPILLAVRCHHLRCRKALSTNLILPSPAMVELGATISDAERRWALILTVLVALLRAPFSRFSRATHHLPHHSDLSSFFDPTRNRPRTVARWVGPTPSPTGAARHSWSEFERAVPAKLFEEGQTPQALKNPPITVKVRSNYE
jgi:hypothetical protein